LGVRPGESYTDSPPGGLRWGFHVWGAERRFPCGVSLWLRVNPRTCPDYHGPDYGPPEPCRALVPTWGKRATSILTGLSRGCLAGPVRILTSQTARQVIGFSFGGRCGNDL